MIFWPRGCTDHAHICRMLPNWSVQWCTRTHAHVLTRTQTLITIMDFYSLTHSHTVSASLTQSNSLALSQTISHKLVLFHTVAHCLTMSHTVTHSHTLSYTVSHRRTQPHTVSHNLTETFTWYFIVSIVLKRLTRSYRITVRVGHYHPIHIFKESHLILLNIIQ